MSVRSSPSDQPRAYATSMSSASTNVECERAVTGPHRAELQRLERPHVHSEADLPEEDRAWRRALDQDREKHEERCGDEEPDERSGDVGRPLDDAIGAREVRRRQADQRER